MATDEEALAMLRIATLLALVLLLPAGSITYGVHGSEATGASGSGGLVLVSQDGDTAVYRWEATLGPRAGLPGRGVATESGVQTAMLALPHEADLQITARLTWATDGDLSLLILDHAGGRLCGSFGPGILAVAPVLGREDHTRVCGVRAHSEGHGDRTVTLQVEGDHNLQDTPFVVLITATRLPATPLHSLSDVLPFSATADDGAVMRGHVYLPDGHGPFPTILNLNPYDNLGDANSAAYGRARADHQTMLAPFDRFMDAGYAVAIVNMRGTGISDGCNSMWDPAIDGADAADVIAAIAASGWSDGTVGMVGISWHGYSQYAALLEQPPALKAVAPASAILDVWSLWTRHGATTNSQFGTTDSTMLAFHAVTTAGTPDGPRHQDCPTAEHFLAYDVLARTGDRSPYFAQRSTRDILAANEIPMLVSNGIQKLLEGHILQVDGLWPLMNAESRLIIGPWIHDCPDEVPEGYYWDAVLTWMDHHVRGIGPAPSAVLVDFQDDEGTWHEATSWPPPTTSVRLFMGDRLLSDYEADVMPSVQVLQSVGTDPTVDTCGGDKAVYVSPPLAEDVTLAGYFQAELTMTSTQPDGNVGIFLWALDDATCPGAGFSQPLVYRDEVSRALSDLAHRGNLDHGMPYPLGVPEVTSMQSHPFAKQVKAGQRLVVAVTGGAVELTPDHLRPELAVHTGEDRPAWIDVPVLSGTLRFA